MAEWAPILVSPTREDILIWLPTHNGVFSVKFATNSVSLIPMNNCYSIEGMENLVETIASPLRLHLHGWRIARDSLPTKENLFLKKSFKILLVVYAIPQRRLLFT